MLVTDSYLPMYWLHVLIMTVPCSYLLSPSIVLETGKKVSLHPGVDAGGSESGKNNLTGEGTKMYLHCINQVLLFNYCTMVTTATNVWSMLYTNIFMLNEINSVQRFKLVHLTHRSKTSMVKPAATSASCGGGVRVAAWQRTNSEKFIQRLSDRPWDTNTYQWLRARLQYLQCISKWSYYSLLLSSKSNWNHSKRNIIIIVWVRLYWFINPSCVWQTRTTSCLLMPRLLG